MPDPTADIPREAREDVADLRADAEHAATQMGLSGTDQRPPVSDQDIAARRAAEQAADDALQDEIDAARTRRDNDEFEAARRQPSAADLDGRDTHDTSQPIGAPLVDPAAAATAEMMSAGGDDTPATIVGPSHADTVALELHATTDAQTWARQFMDIAPYDARMGDPAVDEGMMIAWFANAIETGRSAGRGRLHSRHAIADVIRPIIIDAAKAPTVIPSTVVHHVADRLWDAMTSGEYGTIPPTDGVPPPNFARDAVDRIEQDGDPDHNDPTMLAQNAVRPVPTARLVNLTPHDIVIFDAARNHPNRADMENSVVGSDVFPVVRVATIPADPRGAARLGTVDLGQWDTVDVDGHPVWIEGVEFGHIENPPPVEPGTRYVVSLPTALAVHRDDFLVPFDEVRDTDGRVVGCRGLARVAG